MGTLCVHYDQPVLQTQKLPQHKPQLMSLQLVAQPGFKPGSLAHQSSALVYLRGQPTDLRVGQSISMYLLLTQ
eukprot:12075348-Ditylum_brightwellii.AAC.1